MGDKIIQLPDGRKVSFPSTMSDDDIGKAISQDMLSQGQVQAEQSKAFNAQQAQQMAQAGQQKIQQKYAPFLNPFSTIGQAVGLPHAGAVVDAALPQMRILAEAAKTGASVPSAPDLATGVLRGVRSVGQAGLAGLSALHPLGFAQAGGVTEAASQAFPDVRPAVNAAMNPISSISNPQTPFGKELAQTGDVAAQIGATGLASSKAPEVARQNVADALSQSAFKIPPGIKNTQRLELLHTAQAEGVNPTRGGLAKIDAAVGDLKSKAEGMEQQAMASGNKTVPTSDLVSSIDGLIDKWSKSDTPETFTKVLQNYKDQVLAQKKPELGIQDMIDLKRNLQGQLSQVYARAMKVNPNMRDNILQDAKSQVEQSVRSKLEDLIPGYGDVNSRIHKLLNLKPYVDQAANRISNQQLAQYKVGDVLFGGTTFGLTHSPVEAAAAIAVGRTMTDPRVQSWIANKISPQESTPFTPPSVSPIGEQSPSGETPPGSPPLTVGGMTPEEVAKTRELYPQFAGKMRPEQSSVPPELQKMGVTFDGINSSGQENYTDRSAGGSTFTRLPTESVKEALLRHRREFYGKK